MIQKFDNYLNEATGVNITLNAYPNQKNVVYPLVPAIDYMGELGVIIGGTWSINNRGEMNKARTTIKALGLNIVNDIDDITGYGDNFQVETMWENGHAFVYFFSIKSKEVNAYVLSDDGAMPLK